METSYANAFGKFLQHTNEKQVLLKETIKILKEYGCDSLLDIGAGNGLMAIPLSESVSRYVAIEQNEKYVISLRQNGLNVLNNSFPIELKEKFDAVLLSHVFSYLHPNHDSLIRAAWQNLNPGGILIVITYRGEDDDWSRFISSLGLHNPGDYPKIFKGMKDLLLTLGETRILKVISTIQTEIIDDMLSAMSFVASNGVPEREEKFFLKESLATTILKDKYLNENGFSFPFQNFVIVTKKDRTCKGAAEKRQKILSFKL